MYNADVRMDVCLIWLQGGQICNYTLQSVLVISVILVNLLHKRFRFHIYDKIFIT